MIDRIALRHRQSAWQGRSGRHYDLVSEHLDRFIMDEGFLYLLAKGTHILWVGSVQDLVADALSRTRFRLALDCADRAYHLGSEADQAERFSIIWDLEGAEPVAGALAA